MTAQAGRDRGGGGGQRGDPGDDLGGVARTQPVMDVHEGAEEERVADGEDDDAAAGSKVGLEPVAALVVEVGEGPVVAARVVGEAGRHRVAQLFLDGALGDEVGGDGARERLLAGAAW